jgi:hypothetical protein
VVITLSIYAGIQTFASDNDLIRSASSDPGFDYSYWLSGTFLLLGSWYSWEPIKAWPETKRLESRRDSHVGENSRGSRSSRGHKDHKIHTRSRGISSGRQDTTGRKSLKLNARRGGVPGAGSIDVGDNGRRGSRVSINLEGLFIQPDSAATQPDTANTNDSPTHVTSASSSTTVKDNKDFVLPAANGKSHLQPGYGSVKFHRKSRREGSRMEPELNSAKDNNSPPANAPSSPRVQLSLAANRGSMAVVEPLNLQDDNKDQRNASTSVTAQSTQEKPKMGTVVMHIPDSFLKS